MLSSTRCQSIVAALGVVLDAVTFDEDDIEVILVVVKEQRGEGQVTRFLLIKAAEVNFSFMLAELWIAQRSRGKKVQL